MSKLSRDIYRRKLERHLSHSFDEPMVSLIAAVVAVQAGNASALQAVPDLSEDALGGELGSTYHIPLWSIETLVNELLATSKPAGFGVGPTRALDASRFRTLAVLHDILVKLENAEDGIFLEKYDVFNEMGRIAQRQFPWQRGIANAPHLYRSMLLYGTGSARAYFEDSVGIALSDFVKVGAYLSSALARRSPVDREQDLSELGITRDVREIALSRLALPHEEARRRAAAIRKGGRHTAYSPSLLRDYPIIAFGERGERLRAPLPDLITYRYTSGLYLDIVKGGPTVWSGIGKRFEIYVLDYLRATMAPYTVDGEAEYGSKKARYRTPDILISRPNGIVAVIECKAKRMSFEARYSDDPVAAAALGFDELAKGMFQIWRFFAHARGGLTEELRVTSDCIGVIVTVDSWLTMARNQAEKVVKVAHALADAEGGIDPEDRRDIAFCQIDDVEFSLQNGTADSFLVACRDISTGEKKGFMLSVAHAAVRDVQRPYPFKRRLADVLPWMADPPNGSDNEDESDGGKAAE